VIAGFHPGSTDYTNYHKPRRWAPPNENSVQFLGISREIPKFWV
jgi:hypothetical protein